MALIFPCLRLSPTPSASFETFLGLGVRCGQVHHSGYCTLCRSPCFLAPGHCEKENMIHHPWQLKSILMLGKSGNIKYCMPSEPSAVGSLHSLVPLIIFCRQYLRSWRFLQCRTGECWTFGFVVEVPSLHKACLMSWVIFLGGIFMALWPCPHFLSIGPPCSHLAMMRYTLCSFRPNATKWLTVLLSTLPVLLEELANHLVRLLQVEVVHACLHESFIWQQYPLLISRFLPSPHHQLICCHLCTKAFARHSKFQH